MTRGALGRLSHVWAFDTTYTAPVGDWTAWLASKPALEIDVFFRCTSGTGPGGLAFEKAAESSGGRLRATCVCEGHCAVPGRRLPQLLARLQASPAPRARHELEVDETFEHDEALEGDMLEGEELDDEVLDEGENYDESAAEWEAEDVGR